MYLTSTTFDTNTADTCLSAGRFLSHYAISVNPLSLVTSGLRQDRKSQLLTNAAGETGRCSSSEKRTKNALMEFAWIRRTAFKTHGKWTEKLSKETQYRCPIIRRFYLRCVTQILPGPLAVTW